MSAAPADPPPTLGAPNPAWCTCGLSGVTDLDRLQDLLLAGFGQREASLMLWHWSRLEVDRHLRPDAPRRRPRKLPQPR